MRKLGLLLLAVVGAARAQVYVTPGGMASMPIATYPGMPFSGTDEVSRSSSKSGKAIPVLRGSSLVARDGQGRVYREVRLTLPGPEARDILTATDVYDPVAKTRLKCFPDRRECELGELKLPLAGANAPAGNSAGMTHEELGDETIDGIVAAHSRTTLDPSPPGGSSAGMAVQDSWYSAELKQNLRLMTENASGKVEVRLHITSRAEPDPRLFAAPKGYKVLPAPGPVVQPPLPPGVERGGGGVSAPVVLVAPAPDFKEESRGHKFSGNVLVYLIVDEAGRPTHLQVLRGMGFGLDAKALQAVSRYKFKPAMKNGQPVKVAMNVEVNFQSF